MGQGQEFHARKMITDGMAAGGWVMLQNVHLSISFCSEIIDILGKYIVDTYSTRIEYTLNIKWWE